MIASTDLVPAPLYSPPIALNIARQLDASGSSVGGIGGVNATTGHKAWQGGSISSRSDRGDIVLIISPGDPCEGPSAAISTSTASTTTANDRAKAKARQARGSGSRVCGRRIVARASGKCRSRSRSDKVERVILDPKVHFRARRSSARCFNGTAVDIVASRVDGGSGSDSGDGGDGGASSSCIGSSRGGSGSLCRSKNSSGGVVHCVVAL